jgi:hypothetical protein
VHRAAAAAASSAVFKAMQEEKGGGNLRQKHGQTVALIAPRSRNRAVNVGSLVLSMKGRWRKWFY